MVRPFYILLYIYIGLKLLAIVEVQLKTPDNIPSSELFYFTFVQNNVQVLKHWYNRMNAVIPALIAE